MNPLDRLMPRLEKLEAIVELAAQMRAAQQRYFRSRERAALLDAKGLEIRLDAALDALGDRPTAHTHSNTWGETTMLQALVMGLLLGLAGMAGAVQLRFDNPTLDGGTLTYDGAGGPAIASGVIFQQVIGVDTPSNPGVSLFCYPVECRLDFTTGANLTEGPPAYTFAGGGALTLTGGLNTAPDGSGLQVALAGTVLAHDGDFADPSLVLSGSAGALFVGVGEDLKDRTVTDFYGIPATGFAFADTVLSLDTVRDPTTGAFSALVTDADFTNTAVPEPATLGLLGLGLVGLGAWRRAQPKPTPRPPGPTPRPKPRPAPDERGADFTGAG